MIARLGIGLLKGLVVGAALGAGFQLGLRWGETTGLLGFLLAMGIGATAGILCGKAPWRAEAWIEAVLKGVFGVGIAALVYWIGTSYLPWSVPFALPYAASGTEWTSMPLLYAPVIGALFGMVVELDNDGGANTSGGRKKAKKNSTGKRAPRTRVSTLEEDEFALPSASGRKKKGA